MKKYTAADYACQLITVTVGVLIALLIDVGALAHMSYDDVKEYAELYRMQELFDTQQRKAIDLVGESIALISGAFDPTPPTGLT